MKFFFLGLPNKEEREAIFNVHLARFRPSRDKDFQLSLLGELSVDFSGAEIEQVVIESMRIGFNEKENFKLKI